MLLDERCTEQASNVFPTKYEERGTEGNEVVGKESGA
jgi:hypothetical protein